MGNRAAGRSLLAVGATCMIFFTLIELYGASVAYSRAAYVLFYVGVGALIIGTVLRLMGRARREL